MKIAHNSTDPYNKRITLHLKNKINLTKYENKGFYIFYQMYFSQTYVISGLLKDELSYTMDLFLTHHKHEVLYN